MGVNVEIPTIEDMQSTTEQFIAKYNNGKDLPLYDAKGNKTKTLIEKAKELGWSEPEKRCPICNARIIAGNTCSNFNCSDGGAYYRIAHVSALRYLSTKIDKSKYELSDWNTRQVVKERALALRSAIDLIRKECREHRAVGKCSNCPLNKLCSKGAGNLSGGDVEEIINKFEDSI